MQKKIQTKCKKQPWSPNSILAIIRVLAQPPYLPNQGEPVSIVNVIWIFGEQSR